MEVSDSGRSNRTRTRAIILPTIRQQLNKCQTR